MHFHVTQLEMIEGDKTTGANLFLTKIFFSPNRLVICLASEFAISQQPSMATKRDLTRTVIYTGMQLFSVLLSGNSGKENCKVWQPLEYETGEVKMKAVDSDFGLSVYWTDKTTTMNMATTWNWTEKRNILSHANLFRYFKIFNKCIDFGCMFIVVHKS